MKIDKNQKRRTSLIGNWEKIVSDMGGLPQTEDIEAKEEEIPVEEAKHEIKEETKTDKKEDILQDKNLEEAKEQKEQKIKKEQKN